MIPQALRHHLIPNILTFFISEKSVATVDYDYSKAYGGPSDAVSSAGGTFGSQAGGPSVFDPRVAGATGAALGSFSDADSFDAAYRDPVGVTNDVVMNIFAPPGKLGVVIDTPDDGAPVVHAVKDTSIIADQIHVGDKLIAVDDEDVRSMTAIKVSKLISRKSANPSRKLTIVRSAAH
jgi:PDZ domain